MMMVKNQHRHHRDYCNMFVIFYDKNNIWNAMTRQTIETNGLNRSPITDAFRSVPHNPCRWLSNSDGLIACMYVHVHMNKIHTVIKLFRSNIADCVFVCVWAVDASSSDVFRGARTIFYFINSWIGCLIPYLCVKMMSRIVCVCVMICWNLKMRFLFTFKDQKNQKMVCVRNLETRNRSLCEWTHRIFFVEWMGKSYQHQQ